MHRQLLPLPPRAEVARQGKLVRGSLVRPPGEHEYRRPGRNGSQRSLHSRFQPAHGGKRQPPTQTRQSENRRGPNSNDREARPAQPAPNAGRCVIEMQGLVGNRPRRERRPGLTSEGISGDRLEVALVRELQNEDATRANDTTDLRQRRQPRNEGRHRASRGRRQRALRTSRAARPRRSRHIPRPDDRNRHRPQ